MTKPVRWRDAPGKTRFVIIRRADLVAAFPKWADHWAFLKKLQAQGDFVVWWTNTMSGPPNGFLSSMDMVATTWNPAEALRVCEERWPEITEGVIVGDTKDMIVAVQEHNKTAAFPWAFLLTKKLLTLDRTRP